MLKNTSKATGTLLAFIAVQTTTSAQSCVYEDDFNDNNTPQSWTNFSTDASRLQCVEQNSRLEFPSPNENLGNNNFSGIVSTDWKIDMQQDWAVSIRYHLLFNPPSYGDTGLAFAVAFEIDESAPDLLTGYSLSGGTANYADGQGNLPYEVTRFWQNGFTEVQSDITRTYTDSTIYVWYDASSGSISHGEVLHGPSTTIYGINGLSNLTTAHLSLVAYSFGFVPPSPGNQSWLDDFCIIYGNLVGDLAGGCCIDENTCIRTLESQCEGTWLGQDVFCERADNPCNDGCTGDINSDGIVDGADLNTLLGDWGQTASIADINQDDLVDGADLNILLGAWGSCP